jgi:hypothetical protein
VIENRGSAGAESAFELLKSAAWADRVQGVRQLATKADESNTFEALTLRLDDENTAVIQEAARALVLHAGKPGLQAVLEVYAENDADVVDYLADELFDLQRRGFPLVDRLREIAGDESSRRRRNTALDLLSQLFDFNAQFRGTD